MYTYYMENMDMIGIIYILRKLCYFDNQKTYMRNRPFPIQAKTVRTIIRVFIRPPVAVLIWLPCTGLLVLLIMVPLLLPRINSLLRDSKFSTPFWSVINSFGFVTTLACIINGSESFSLAVVGRRSITDIVEIMTTGRNNILFDDIHMVFL